MSRRVLAASVVILLSVVLQAQERQSPAALIAAERDAMKPLAWMNGVWRGPAWALRPDGTKHESTQTERIGSFLDGSVRVIEGRGYDANGTVTFNAFGIVSYNPATKTYSLHSHAMGMAGDFAFEPTADGYIWTVPAGPGATIRYTAVCKDGRWREIGERIAAGKAPLQIFEMNLERVGDTDWPAAGAISAK